MAPAFDNGIVTIASRHTVDDTVARLEQILATKQIKLFAVIDHSGEAAAAGLEMRPAKLIIFGNPKAGTPVMVASPTAAIDLPLKILVDQGSDGTVRVTYNSPEYLQARHAFPPGLIANLAAVETIARAAAE